MSLSDKLIINAAITGMVPMKDDNAHVPIDPQEIAADVRRCYEAGASIFHIHARDDKGLPTYRREYYEEIVASIREEVPDSQLVICLTTSGRVHNSFETRSEVLDIQGALKPDMASLTLGSLNFPNQASVNAPDIIRALADKMHERDVVPELEAFNLGMIDYAAYLIQREIVHPPYYINLLLGSLGTLSATPLNLALMVNALPSGMTWAATGIGRFQFQVNALAVTMGGHVRVGLEDAIYMDRDKHDLATNLRLVERIVKVARAVGREPASALETRKIIGLKARDINHHHAF